MVETPIRFDRHGIMKGPPADRWRWAGLIAAIAGLAHERMHLGAGARSTASFLEAHGSLTVLPASAWGAWTLIQLVLVAYAMVQLVEEQREVATYDRVSRLVVAIAVLGSVRLMMISIGSVWLVTAVAVSTAAIAAVAYVRVEREITAERASKWFSVPFSLLLAWTTMVAIASVDAAVASAGCPTAAPAVLLIAGAAGAAMWLGLHVRDFLLPGFVAWLVTAICATNRLSTPLAAGTLIASALCAIVGIVIAATAVSRPPPAASPSPTRRSRRA